MIEHFKEWLDDGADRLVTLCNPEKDEGLQNNSREINDVTHVTDVTHKNTSSCEASSEFRQLPNPETEAIMSAEAGYKGYAGYNADSATPSPVTHDVNHRVTRVTDPELEASLQRLVAMNISIAVFDDGSMRVVQSRRDAEHAFQSGGTVYSPKDMWMYVTLSARERRILHDFKKRFKGTVEWKEQP